MCQISLLTSLLDCTIILTMGNFSLEIPISSLHEYQNVDGFKLDRQKLTTVQVLGSGNFGQVCKAIYGPLRTEVVVKSLKGTFNPILLSNMAVYVFLSEPSKIW